MNKNKRLALAIGILFMGNPVIALADQMESETPFQLATVSSNFNPSSVISSSSIALTETERRAGVETLPDVLDVFQEINQRFNIFTLPQFNYFIKNFHYPFRQSFDLSRTQPPAQVVLHWTANKRPDIPLYTLSAFLRSRRGRQVVERPNRYKNVSNYFLTGILNNAQGRAEARLLKLTRGDLRTGGDIPRVTAYPTKDSHDNKYDGRGAIGIEIESPNFGSFYSNESQREKIHNFLLLVLSERGVLNEFKTIRQSAVWEDMASLHRYLKQNISRIDVDQRGGISAKNQHLDKMLRDFPDISPRVNAEAQRIFKYISGHGIVAREYNEHMLRAGRPQDARYHKIDFTEAHVFVVAMDLLSSDMRMHGLELPPTYDLATLRMMQQRALMAQADNAQTPAAPAYLKTASGRKIKAE